MLISQSIDLGIRLAITTILMSSLVNNALPLFTTLEMYTHLILAQTVPALSLHCSAELAAVRT
jgi:hypothetical protein